MGALVVELAGEYDLSTVPQLEPLVAGAIDGWSEVVFDLTRVRYMDSSMLSMLVRVRNRIGAGMRVVVKPGSIMRRILEIAGLDAALGVTESPEVVVPMIEPDSRIVREGLGWTRSARRIANQ